MLYYHQENQVKLEKLNKSAHYFVMGHIIYPQNKVCSKISYRHFKAIDTKLNRPRKWEYRNKGCLIVQKKKFKNFLSEPTGPYQNGFHHINASLI